MKKRIIIAILFISGIVACNQGTNEPKSDFSPDQENMINETADMPEWSEEDKKAMEIIQNLPDVKEFVQKENGIVEIDHVEGDSVFVHVYKITVHEEGGATTGTFNWYVVNKKTGGYYPMFE